MDRESTGRTTDRSLVLFSPMPPKQNGIADYVAEQLPYLSRHYTVTVVIGNADADPTGLPEQVEVIRVEQYKACFQQYAEHRHLYHVGNNTDHGYLLPILYRRPGVVVIHDLGLHHLIDTCTLEKHNAPGYAWALWQQYGRMGKRLGEQFLEYGWKGQIPHELRLNGAIIKAAQRVIVHSHYSAYRILAEFPRKPVAVIPHHLSPAISRYNRARRTEARIKVGLPTDRPVVTSLGFITRPKQIEAILGVLATLKSQGERFYYVLAGQYRPHEYDVKADLQRFGLQDEVLVTDYLDEDAFFTHLVATDLILNLRYPSGGETSGTLTRALGMGRCCVVVNIGAFAEIPADCAVKLNWDEAFADNLLTCVGQLLRDPQLRVGYEVRSRDWVSGSQAIQLTTQAYAAEIDALDPSALPQPVASSPAKLNGPSCLLMNTPGCSAALYPDALTIEGLLKTHAAELSAAVQAGAGLLWWRQGLVARADGTSLALDVQRLEQIDPVLSILQPHLGYTTDQIVILNAQRSQGMEFQRVLALKSFADMAVDPVLQIARLSTQMAIGAELVLSIDGLDRGTMTNRSLCLPQGWMTALESAGFQLAEHHCAQSDITFSEFQQHTPELVFRARKISEQIERYPGELYPDCQPHWATLDEVIGSAEAVDVTPQRVIREAEFL